MSDTSLNHEELLWSILIGGAILNKDFRTEAIKNLPVDDAPKPLRDLWRCITEANATGLRQVLAAYKVEVSADGHLPSIMRKLMETASTRYYAEAAQRTILNKHLDPSDLADAIESLAANVRARKEKLDRARQDAKDRIAAAEKAKQGS